MTSTAVNAGVHIFYTRVPVGLNPLLHFRSPVLSRRAGTWKPYSRKSATCVTWTHKFVCLNLTRSERVPSTQEKYDLKCADLGEKKVVFRLDGGWSHIKETLLTEFPLLSNGGGFELLRTDGPYSRCLVPIDATHLTGVSKLKQFVDQARVYIRPIQADLTVQTEASYSRIKQVRV